MVVNCRFYYMNAFIWIKEEIQCTFGIEKRFWNLINEFQSVDDVALNPIWDSNIRNDCTTLKCVTLIHTISDKYKLNPILKFKRDLIGEQWSITSDSFGWIKIPFWKICLGDNFLTIFYWIHWTRSVERDVVCVIVHEQMTKI